jgi:Rrf2 family protein
MRLSTRSRYGVRLMLNLAINSAKGPIFLKDIASDEDISEKYLGQIIIPLKAKGLVNTFRGAHGGYILSCPASEIKLREIIETLETDLSPVDCVGNSSVCNRASDCVTRDVWCRMGSLIIEFLDSISLEDLVNNYKEKTSAGRGADYNI